MINTAFFSPRNLIVILGFVILGRIIFHMALSGIDGKPSENAAS